MCTFHFWSHSTSRCRSEVRLFFTDTMEVTKLNKLVQMGTNKMTFCIILTLKEYYTIFKKSWRFGWNRHVSSLLSNSTPPDYFHFQSRFDLQQRCLAWIITGDSELLQSLWWHNMHTLYRTFSSTTKKQQVNVEEKLKLERWIEEG